MPILPLLAVIGGSFSVVPEAEVAKGAWGCAYECYGIGGAGFLAAGHDNQSTFLQQAERVIASGKSYDGVVLWCSTNDAWIPNSLAPQNAAIEAVVTRLREAMPNTRVVCFASSPLPLNNELKRIPELAAGQLETCRKLGVPVLDQFHEITFPAENVRECFVGDNTHMTRLGYTYLAACQTPFIKGIFLP